MRGHVDRQESMWFTMRTEDFIPENHPLREIKKLADAELARLAPVLNGPRRNPCSRKCADAMV